jgi:hypothetical protein
MAKDCLAVLMNALEMAAAFMVKLYTRKILREPASMNVPNVVEKAMKENVAGRDANTPIRLSATIEKAEEDRLVLTGIVSILNAVSTTKRISIIQL